MTGPTRPRVLMVGSSIFGEWGGRASEAFPAADVTNAAVNGTQTVDWLPRIQDDLAEHRPDALVVYCGSNDIAHGRSAKEISGNLIEWRRRVEAFDSHIAFVYFGIIKCPAKSELYGVIDAVHAAVIEHARRGDRFVDLDPVFWVDGLHPPGLFVEDGVHLTDAAYIQMAEHVRQVLQDTPWI